MTEIRERARQSEYPLSWLATRAGKMATSCPLVISRRCPARIKISFDYEINPSSLVWVHKNAKILHSRSWWVHLIMNEITLRKVTFDRNGLV